MWILSPLLLSFSFMILLALFPSVSPFVVLFSISTSATLSVCPRLGFPQERAEPRAWVWAVDLGSDSWDWVTSQSLGSMWQERLLVNCTYGTHGFLLNSSYVSVLGLGASNLAEPKIMRQEHAFHSKPLRVMVGRNPLQPLPRSHLFESWAPRGTEGVGYTLSPSVVLTLCAFSSSFSVSVSFCLISASLSLWEDRCCGGWGHICPPIVPPTALPHLGYSFLRAMGDSGKCGAEGSLWEGAAYERKNI